jgi:hypothetical protein
LNSPVCTDGSLGRYLLAQWGLIAVIRGSGHASFDTSPPNAAQKQGPAEVREGIPDILAMVHKAKPEPVQKEFCRDVENGTSPGEGKKHPGVGLKFQSDGLNYIEDAEQG